MENEELEIQSTFNEDSIENEELEIQSTFNEDSIEILCEDADVENSEEIEVNDNEDENE